MSEEELAGALRRLSEVTERSRERKAQRERMWEHMSGLTATEAGAGGAVRVTVGAGGELTGLDLAESTRSLPSAMLSTQIMAAVRRAQATLARQVAALGEQGAEPDPMVAGIVARYRSQFPEQPPDTGVPPAPAMPPPPMPPPGMAPPRMAPPRAAPRPPMPPPPPRQARPTPPRPVYEDDDFSQETFLRRH